MNWNNMDATVLLSRRGGKNKKAVHFWESECLCNMHCLQVWRLVSLFIFLIYVIFHCIYEFFYLLSVFFPVFLGREVCVLFNSNQRNCTILSYVS